MAERVINKIQQYRKEKGVTQEALAEAVLVTRQTIIAVEKGNYTPSVALALKFSLFFDVPTETLFSLKQ